jgi:hypothetical protein
MPGYDPDSAVPRSDPDSAMPGSDPGLKSPDPDSEKNALIRVRTRYR